MRPDALSGLLAESDPVATFSAVVLGAATPSEVLARTGLSGRDVVAALHRLELGGLVATVEGRLVAQATAVKAAVREHAPFEKAHDDHAPLRRYLIDEGLMSRENGGYWRTGGYVDPAPPPRRSLTVGRSA